MIWQFRLWPGKYRWGIPKKEVDLKPPFVWKSGKDWDPDPQKDVPEFPDEFFLCHWEHPEEKHSRLLKATKLTFRDTSQKFAKLRVTRFMNRKWEATKLTFRDASQKFAKLGVARCINRRWKAAVGKLRQRRQPFPDSRIEEGAIPDPREDHGGIVTVAEFQGVENPQSFFLPSHPKKVLKKLKPDAPYAPRGWGLFVEEEKKKFRVPFFLSLGIFFVNLGVFGYVMSASKWPLGSMFFSGSSLAWAIVIFFMK
jgi:hypothetical protein